MNLGSAFLDEIDGLVDDPNADWYIDDLDMLSPEEWIRLRNSFRYAVKSTSRLASWAAPVASYFFPDWGTQISMSAYALSQIAQRLEYEDLPKDLAKDLLMLQNL